MKSITLMALVAASAYLSGCGGGSGGIANSSIGTGDIEGYLYTRVAGRTAEAAPDGGYIALNAATVTCSGKAANTNANGYYKVLGVPQGSVSCTVTKTGYTPFTFTVTVAAGKTNTVNDEGELPDNGLIPVAAATGTLVVNSTPAGAAISIDGSSSGATTSATFNSIASGDHSVSVSLTGYETPAATSTTITTGQTSTLAFTLTLLTSSIALAPAATIEVGGTQALTATCTLSDASTPNCTSSLAYTSSAPTVATVNSSTGVVTAVSPGTTTITGTKASSNVSGTVVITVTCPTGQSWHNNACTTDAVQSITITAAGNATSRDVGATLQFTAACTWSVAGSAPCPTGIAWNSSATATATIDSSGLLTAVAPGTTSVTASYNSITSSAKSIVVQPAIETCGTSSLCIKASDETGSPGSTVNVDIILDNIGSNTISTFNITIVFSATAFDSVSTPATDDPAASVTVSTTTGAVAIGNGGTDGQVIASLSGALSITADTTMLTIPLTIASGVPAGRYQVALTINTLKNSSGTSLLPSATAKNGTITVQ